MPGAEIKKGKGIEELLTGYGEQAETEKEVKTEGESMLSGVMRKYENALQIQFCMEYRQMTFVRGNESLDDILTPDEIDSFLQSTMQHENNEAYSANTGAFISRLIQNSYNAGHNQFHLNTENLKEIDRLAAYVKGDKKRPLMITITGNIGDTCGRSVQNAVINIEGNTGYSCAEYAVHSTFNIQGNTASSCGYGAENLEFNIKGDTAEDCGRYAKHSTFNIQGNTGKECGYGAKHSTFNIKREAGIRCGNSAHHSTFITPRKKTLKQFENYVPEGNRIVLTHPDGTEEIARDYDDKR